MSDFRSAYSGQIRHTSLTGNGREPEYEYKVTDDGRELVKTGEMNIYALIQSHLDETKIENIIKRATCNPAALGSQDWQTSKTITDISDAPTNYHEWYGRIKEAESEFEKLPIEVKNKWDNDVEKYIMAYGTEDWADKMGMMPKKNGKVQPDTTKPKNKTNNNEEVSN